MKYTVLLALIVLYTQVNCITTSANSIMLGVLRDTHINQSRNGNLFDICVKDKVVLTLSTTLPT